jgi:transposase-like protein
MTRTNTNALSIQERQRRVFSEELKVKKVKEIERGISTIAEICKAYQVSDTSVRKWLNKYSTMKKSKERLIVESQSETQKIIELKKQIADLERLLGQKQIQIEFKDKMIDLAEEVYKIDIKKNFGTKPSSDSGKK